MSTGITVSDAVIAKFDAFKLKKVGDVKYITMVINKTEVVLESEYPKSMSMEDFMNTLENAPKFVLIDHEYKTNDGRDADKICLVSWIPDTAKVKDKMVASGTKEAVKSALTGIAININATDKSECSAEILNAACTKI
ncbi:hypothetical protein M885DRAFT_520976 [Pelagophyceae sp. CCMP2097]|nr:hypothetical protein M885DRAFT_520976 [Pelagophyceae sp. CCMP2097]